MKFQNIHYQNQKYHLYFLKDKLIKIFIIQKMKKTSMEYNLVSKQIKYNCEKW